MEIDGNVWKVPNSSKAPIGSIESIMNSESKHDSIGYTRTYPSLLSTNTLNRTYQEESEGQVMPLQNHHLKFTSRQYCDELIPGKTCFAAARDSLRHCSSAPHKWWLGTTRYQKLSKSREMGHGHGPSWVSRDLYTWNSKVQWKYI